MDASFSFLIELLKYARRSSTALQIFRLLAFHHLISSHLRCLHQRICVCGRHEAPLLPCKSGLEFHCSRNEAYVPYFDSLTRFIILTIRSYDSALAKKVRDLVFHLRLVLSRQDTESFSTLEVFSVCDCLCIMTSLTFFFSRIVCFHPFLLPRRVCGGLTYHSTKCH